MFRIQGLGNSVWGLLGLGVKDKSQTFWLLASADWPIHLYCKKRAASQHRNAMLQVVDRGTPRDLEPHFLLRTTKPAMLNTSTSGSIGIPVVVGLFELSAGIPTPMSDIQLTIMKENPIINPKPQTFNPKPLRGGSALLSEGTTLALPSRRAGGELQRNDLCNHVVAVDLAAACLSAC